MEGIQPVASVHFYQIIYRGANKVVDYVLNKMKEMMDESKEAHREGVARDAKMRAYNRRIHEIRSRPV